MSEKLGEGLDRAEAAKNRMVKEFYGRMGFTLIEEKEDGSSIWEMDTDSYKPKNTVIQITGY